MKTLIYTNKNSLASIVIDENENGEIIISCTKTFPKIIMIDSGEPGVIGPDIELDTKILVRNEIQNAIESMKDSW